MEENILQFSPKHYKRKNSNLSKRQKIHCTKVSYTMYIQHIEKENNKIELPTWLCIFPVLLMKANDCIINFPYATTHDYGIDIPTSTQ